jgi:membrane-associated protease RseP (regulator of RpoE activity)
LLNDQAENKQDVLNAIVERVFKIDDYTLGDPHQKQPYIIKYRGHLRLEDTEAAYNKLATQLKPLNITPLFRLEDNRHMILLMQGVVRTGPSRQWINLLLFGLTFFSVLFTGAMYGMTDPVPSDPLQAVLAFIDKGWPFAVSMLAILAAHEFGHYLMGRHHGVNVSLPYFIPLPLSPFGTMGAFINMKEPPRNRRILLDIGIAGPLAGMIVAVPVLALGLYLSKVDQLPLTTPQGMMIQMEGNSLLYLFMKFLVFGKLLPAPASFGNISPLLYWIRYFITGRPFPMGGTDVLLHPVAWAGWAGLLVTALNLIPAGQLDGGHMLYVLLGRERAKKILPYILGGLVLLGLAWSGWWLWAALIFFLGRVYAEPLDQITPLDSGRRKLAFVALGIFLLTFTPVPLNIF